MKGQPNAAKRKPKRLNRREIRKLIDRTSLDKHQLYYEKVGESPKGLEFHIDRPNWRDRLAWRTRSFVRCVLGLERAGVRGGQSRKGVLGNSKGAVK